jgi:hypothetical protein
VYAKEAAHTPSLGRIPQPFISRISIIYFVCSSSFLSNNQSIYFQQIVFQYTKYTQFEEVIRDLEIIDTRTFISNDSTYRAYIIKVNLSESGNDKSYTAVVGGYALKN